jgi:ABC-type proline/glycine betaine transport system substrate-binding protein
LDAGLGAFFYLWTPHPLNAQYSLNRIQLPAYSPEGFALGTTDYPIDVLEKVGSKRLADLAPGVATVYSRFYIDNSDQEVIMAPLEGTGQSLSHAVCAWVRTEGKAAIWQAWLPSQDLLCTVGQIANGSACEVCLAGSHSLGGTQTA